MLALDVGNGSVKYARFGDEGQRLGGGRLDLESAPQRLPDEDGSVEIAAVSVNTPVLERIRERFPRIRVVGEDLPLPIQVLYEPPEACGLDRVMSVVAALHRLPKAAGVLVLDVGTCLTATVGFRGRGVVGGAILPGVDLMLRSLAEWTAALPEVEAREPMSPIGRSTAESMRSGAWAAWVGAARELIRTCRLESEAPLHVLAAGTGAEALAARVPEVDFVDPFLTLRGVHLTARAAP